MSDEFDNLHAPPPASEEGESLVELLSHYWLLLKRYYWILIITGAIGVASAYFWTQNQPRIYSSTTKIVFHQSKQNVFGQKIDRVEMMETGDRWGFETFWNTQREVFQSQWFAEKVIKEHGLLDEPAFLTPSAEKMSEEERLSWAASRVLGMTTVSRIEMSRVVSVIIRTTDPELAAVVANGVANTYVTYTREIQSGGLDQLVNWFDSYVATKQQELTEAQTELQRFKRDHNILSLSYEDRQNLTSSNMQAVHSQLIDVRGELSAQDALMHQLDELEQSDQNRRAIADLVDNDTLKRAYDREAALEQSLAKLQTRYLDGHPDIQAASTELETVRRQIDSELERVSTAVSNNVEVLERHESNLEAELSSLKTTIFELNELGLEHSRLTDRADSLKQLYETVLGRSAELDLNALYHDDIIQVLERAKPNPTPISPDLPLNLAAGLLFGLILGAVAMVLRDALDATVKSEEDVSRIMREPILAMLPRLEPSVLKTLECIGDSPADTITHTAPKSSFAEGIKTLRTNLLFMAPDNPPKLLLVTSPGPGEGKTLTSVNMAIAMAQSGQKTLLLDTDMRRPRLHKALGVSGKENGLSSVIMERTAIEDAIESTVVDNLEVLTCGEIPPNPSELLHSDRFNDLVGQLRESYDRVIFDSPPLGAVSDALILSQAVDGVLLILKFGQSRKELLRRSVDQLTGIGAPIMGAVLNEITSDTSNYAYSYYYRYSYEEMEKADKPKLVG
jgi:capsular exopolysaccharide synthesis family protein